MDKLTQAVLEAEGDLALVASRILGHMEKSDEILAALAADHAAIDAFAAKARAYTLIKTIAVFAALHTQVITNIHTLEAKQAMQAFIKVAEVMSALSEQQNKVSTNINIFENIMRMVPAPVAEALQVALQASNNIASSGQDVKLD